MNRALYNVVKATESIYTNVINCSVLKNRADVTLAEALNDLFKDFRCDDVIVNENTDRQFFGMYIRPSYCLGMTGDFTSKMFKDYQSTKVYFESFKAGSYCIEIDGKLIRDIGLTVKELVACMIGEIYALYGVSPIEKLRNAIDLCLSEYGMEGVCVDSIKKSKEIFYLVSNITIHNMVSAFNTTKNNFQYVDGYPSILKDDDPDNDFNLPDAYMTAMEKLDLSGYRMEDYDTSMILLSWYFNMYQDIMDSRELQNMLRDALQYEPSRLVRGMILSAYDSINKEHGEGSYLYDVMNESKKGLIYQMKRNGIKAIEEDLYEYNMRLRNVETQDEAILLMRQINSRMGILEDYIREEELDEADRARWEKCYQSYVDLREELSKKTVYNRKMYGLFVDYNALHNMSDNGTFMNTYY